MDRFSEAQAGKIRLCHGPTQLPLLIESQQVVVIAVIRDELQDLRRVAQVPQRHGGKERPVEAVGLSFAQYAQGTAVEMVLAVRDAVQKGLDPGGAIQTSQVAFFRRV
jgi:hypothetical protein